MLADVLGCLRCPHCGAGLAEDAGAVRCARGHAFDVARQGYVNLRAGGDAAAGDSAPMVAARERFLAAGHFQPLAEELAAEATRALGAGPPGCVVDLGAGTGWYLAQVLDRLPARVGVALDASRYALRRAARAHPRAAAVGCDVWRGLPLGDGTAALALNVFAPRNGEEIARVLQPDGSLLVATPTPRHLAELVDALGLLTVDPRKRQRLDAALRPRLAPTREVVHERRLRLGRQDVADLASMGPSAWHQGPAGARRRADGLPETVRVTVSVALATYRRGPA